MRSLEVMLLMVVTWASLDRGRTDWCYTDPACGPLTWGQYGSCNGTRQSPVDIAENSTIWNASLTPFNFTGYGDTSKLISITNLGDTVTVNLAGGVTIAGGGLSAEYSALTFHFHWGNGSTSSGSEHRLSGKQFPMEMHIVHTKNGMNLSESKKDPTGIAVLGVLIDVSSSSQVSAFQSLSSLLSQITNSGSSLQLNGSLSMDALLGGLDRTAYYRYLGSLTIPICDEAVVWTVFKNPILVPPSVINAFSSQLYVNSSVGDHIVNVFRPLQALGTRQVQTSTVKAANTTMASSTSTTMASSTSTTMASATSATSRGSPSSLHFALASNLPVVLAFLALLQMAA